MISLEPLIWTSQQLIYPGNLLVLVCFLLYYSKRPIEMKWLGYYGVASSLFHFGQILSNSGPMKNTIGNAWTLTELVLFSMFYFLVIPLKGYRNWIVFSGIAYLLFYFMVFTFYPLNFYSYIRGGRDLTLMLYAILYFFYLLKKLPQENLLGLPMFWINVAVIFFFSSTFIVSLFRDYLVTVLKNDMSGFWAFRNFLRFVFCVILSYGGWLDLQLVRKMKMI